MRTVRLLYFCCLATLAALVGMPALSTQAGITISNSTGSPVIAQGTDKLIYADFENVKDKRAFSNRGGYVQLVEYSERPTLKSRFKGLEGSSPPAPEIVRLRPDDPNRAIAFEFEMQALNAWPG